MLKIVFLALLAIGCEGAFRRYSQTAIEDFNNDPGTLVDLSLEILRPDWFFGYTVTRVSDNELRFRLGPGGSLRVDAEFSWERRLFFDLVALVFRFPQEDECELLLELRSHDTPHIWTFMSKVYTPPQTDDEKLAAQEQYALFTYTPENPDFNTLTDSVGDDLEEQTNRKIRRARFNIHWVTDRLTVGQMKMSELGKFICLPVIVEENVLKAFQRVKNQMDIVDIRFFNPYAHHNLPVTDDDDCDDDEDVD